VKGGINQEDEYEGKEWENCIAKIKKRRRRRKNMNMRSQISVTGILKVHLNNDTRGKQNCIQKSATN